jgi:hypothetical protein
MSGLFFQYFQLRAVCCGSRSTVCIPILSGLLDEAGGQAGDKTVGLLVTFVLKQNSDCFNLQVTDSVSVNICQVLFDGIV